MSDNLESFFKNRLNEDMEAEGWNTPSDRVWDKVAPEIQKESGIFLSWKKILMILSGITVIALLSITYFFILNNNSKSVEDELVTGNYIEQTNKTNTEDTNTNNETIENNDLF